MSIRTRLLLYVVPLIVVPIILLAFFSYRFLMEGFEEQVRLERIQLSQIATERIEQKLDECYANMLVLQSEAAKEWEAGTHFETSVGNGNAHSARLAQRFAIRHSPYVQIRITRADGFVLMATRGLDLDRSSQNALSDSVFLQAVAIGFLKRSPSQFPADSKNGNRITSFAAPIFSRIQGDSLLGMLFLDLDLRFVDNVLVDMNTLQSGEYVLVDGEGSIIADNGLPQLTRSKILRSIGAVPSIHDQEGDGLLATAFLTTKPVKEYIAFLAPVPQERWYIAIVSSSSPLGTAFRRTQLVFFLILAAALVSGIAGTAFVARKITQPIGKLTQATERFAQGDLQANIPVQSKDEIGMLTADFNKMAGDLRRLMRERQTNETLLAIGRVSSSLVHDLRNPIEGMKLLSTELLKRIELGRGTQEVADTIHQSVGRLSSLLTQSLNFARLTHPVFSPTNIVTLADEAISDIRFGRVALQKKYNANTVVAEIDTVQIKRVLSNILLNAVEACRDNPPDSPGVVELLLRTEDSKIRIEIADNGPGIPQEDKEKIFEPFFTSKPEGHGLGLSFGRQIIRNHGGELTLISELGKGARFIVLLPKTQHMTMRA